MTNAITEEQIRAWCVYLAAIHTASGNDVELPISPNCLHPTQHHTGCGTCYWCAEQLITRALFTTSTSLDKIPAVAHQINEAVFAYIAPLDPERLITPDGDNYVRMTSAQFARVMNWASTYVRHPAPVAETAQPVRTW